MLSIFAETFMTASRHAPRPAGRRHPNEPLPRLRAPARTEG